MTFDLSSWPPTLTPDQLAILVLEANTYALAHGLMYLPTTTGLSIPGSAVHAPFTLLPTPLPRYLFERAQRLQSFYNVLYARIASDYELLDRVMGAEVGVGRVDEFTGTLWKGWKGLREKEGGNPVQPLQLGLFRSDYLMDTPSSASEQLSLKQVEFNTISVSFGALSTVVSSLHQHLWNSCSGYFGISDALRLENLPPNQTLSQLAAGLAKGHKAYGVGSAAILMVVQPGERNVFDQRFVEYELWKTHHIRLVRLTFEELGSSASVDPNTHVLTIPHSTSTTPLEISVIYYRAGYTPTDYPTPEHYTTRIILESSRAIKCPSIPLQLAGGKKIQEYITQPGILESILLDDSTAFTPDDLSALRETWVGMWGLDSSGDSNENTKDGITRARENHAHLVLKPQREGGGNNIYKSSIPGFLETLLESEREAWIAMEMITPPEGVANYLVKAGESETVQAEVVSELGVFGWALFESVGGKASRVVKEEEAGWLVRTKGKESDEGGVAVGFSVLDSIVLVD